MTDLQDLIGQASAGGWDWFDNAGEAIDGSIKDKLSLNQEKDNQDQAAINGAWRDFAATPGGEKALRQLFDNTLGRTVYFVALGLDPHSTAFYGAFREGQMSVAQFIAKAIAEGRGETVKPRDV